jgi:formylglycine-generating enzyme required for sulfatase activity
MSLSKLLPGLLACLLCAAARGDDEAPGKRVALLVGINAYQKPFFDNLKYAERDVEEVGKELKMLGFEVTTLTGDKATRKAIDDTANRLVEPLAKDDVMLVMLCGHGLQVEVKLPDGSSKNDAFFCPYDAVATNPQTLFSLSRLIDEILAPNVGRKLVLVDACRNDPDPARSASRGIEGKVIALPEDTAVMFSCRKGQKSFENDKLRHGLFTYCVLDGLRGEATNARDEIDWTGLAAHVNLQMSSPDFRKKYLPGGGARQEPIPAGGVPYTMLGRLVRVKAVPMPNPATPTRSSRVPSGSGLEGMKAGEVREFGEIALKMCWCPPGSFRMGSPTTDVDADDDEKPQVTVTLSHGFWLGQTEVTQSQWASVMGSEPWKGQEEISIGSEFPATYVDWTDSVKYCEKLTLSQRQANQIPVGWKYRLPTEAEWEFAARAGTTTRYCFGDDAEYLSDYAWWGYLDRGTAKDRSPYRVGKRAANNWNLHDMHGNVYEWCEDTYDRSLPGGRDPVAKHDGGSVRVFRGGGWKSPARYCRTANRSADTPDNRGYDLGFRLALCPSGS